MRNDIVTEDSAGLAFTERHAGTLLFDHDAGSWFNWIGSHWRKETTGLAFSWARDLARDLAKDEAAKVRYVTSKVSFAAGVERFARTDRTLAVTSSIWNPDPLLLGTPGGTVDLRTGILRPADPADRITKLVAVTPSFQANCPTWIAFLRQSTGSDEELVRFLQQFCGYSLTGITREHALLFIYGPGGNGKSVYLNTISGVLGDYATTASMETFTASAGDRHPTDLAMLLGARLVSASETEEGPHGRKAASSSSPAATRSARVSCARTSSLSNPSSSWWWWGTTSRFCETSTMPRGAASISSLSS
jgi:putative DNA primase/helicase